MTIDRTFVALPSLNQPRAGAGGHPCQGLYYTPSGTRPDIAVIATHYQVDFSEHYLAEYMAERGYGFLGWNNRFRGNDSHFILDMGLSDIGQGVRWLKEQAGVEKVILLGNSGGGSLMAAYQSQAVAPYVEPGVGMQLSPGLDELIPGDGYVSCAAHLGRPDVLTAWSDASVTDERDPLATDPTLDLFNPDNGPSYSEEFVRRYRDAQVARNHRITAWVKAELTRLSEAGYHDRPFSIARTWADPRMVDPSIEPTKREPNSCYLGRPIKANRSVYGIAAACTLRTWLSLWSLEDSQTRAHTHLPKITVPALVINANADTGVFPSDAQAIYDLVGAQDKQSHAFDTDHYFRTDGARDAQADLIDEWIKARFV